MVDQQYYVPPFPARPTTPLKPLQILRAGKKNLLRVFSKINFEEDVIRTQVLTQSIVIANSPEYVKWAFVTSHQYLESKSHLMKRALKPIIGDGLFISDGTLWANRRKPVGAAIHGSKLPYYYNSMVDAISELQLL